MSEKLHNHALQSQKQVISRLAKIHERQRIGHAYIFDGSNGAGKEAIAQYFTKLLLCMEPKDNVPCETCHSCKRIESGNHPNVVEIRPDGQGIKKEQMSGLIMKMTKKGFEEGRKVYVIVQAERMNTSAANTLLKFLEEPEGNVTAILLTESYPSILPTIQSRCQRISLQPMNRQESIERLVEKGITASMAATVTMMTANVEAAFDMAQEDSFVQRRKLVLKLVEAIEQRSPGEALLFIQTDWMPVMKEKSDCEQGLDLLLFAYRDIVAVKAGLQSTIAYPDQLEPFTGYSVKNAYSSLTVKIDAILQAKKRLHQNMNRTLLLEQLVLTMQEGLLFV
ncbi:DNA polymerase III subunit delta' [Sporosarcina sp. P37]|uniref:DNA polymerase III subunit delta' n=1 Tax=unclassified Sporosarcina TaxID=2647733 RepID=UPI000A17BE34|nr:MULTISPECIES: DNA polymerase III subunit delta' [unclassified Sporosarcina]ARK24940.1 DNA polymerase III subunit delta' [Sporosarcina sp. P37]PID18078.1 DNA polymerase III subunit delta' [Sporosarcina sp. P35]